MMRIDCISDTHGEHTKLKLPGGDVLIHAGDFSADDAEVEQILDFLDWFSEQKYAHHLLVAGNHDNFFELLPDLMEEECEKRKIVLLNDSGCVIEGIPIWGSPIQPGPSDWAFCRENGAEIKKHWDLIPKDTEILITHGPPYKIRDEIAPDTHIGCEELSKKIPQTCIKLHVFGHVHKCAGQTIHEDRLYLNASSGITRILRDKGQYKGAKDAKEKS